MMKKLLFIAIIFLLAHVVHAEGLYYAISLESHNETMVITHVDVVFSHEVLKNIVNEQYFRTYTLNVYNKEQQKKESIEFGLVNLVITDAGGEDLSEGQALRLTDNSFIVYAPYVEDGDTIVIYNEEGTRAAQKDVRIFSHQRGEVAGENKEDSTTGQNPRSSENEIRYSFIYGIIFVIVILLLFLLLIKRTEKK